MLVRLRTGLKAARKRRRRKKTLKTIASSQGEAVKAKLCSRLSWPSKQ